MLTSFRVYRETSTYQEFSLQSGTTFKVKSVDGLGPPGSSVVSHPLVDVDAFKLNDPNQDSRRITIKIGLNPDWGSGQSVATLRRSIYGFFPRYKDVTLEFFSDHMPAVKTVGRVASIKPSIFSPETDLEIVVVCPDAFFFASARVNFPNVAGASTFTLLNPGTAPVGFRFDVNFPASNTSFQLARQDDSSVFFASTKPSVANVSYSTEVGNKFAKNGATFFYSTINADTSWFALKPGNNVLVYSGTALGAISNLSILPKYSSL